MTPKRLLLLWRERWGKGGEHRPDRPYAQGSLHRSLYRIPSSRAWEWPGTTTLSLLIGAAFLFFVIQLQLTLNGRISLGLALVALAIAARRFEGALFALTVVCLGVLASGQYFYWRFTQTLVIRTDLNLFTSMGLATVELCWVAAVFLYTVNRLWPMRAEERPADPLASSGQTLDVIACVDELDDEQSLNFLDRCGAIDWPEERRQLIIIDALVRPGVAAFAQTHGAIVLSSHDKNPGATASEPILDAAIRSGHGDLVLVTDPRSAPAPDLIRRVIGWFSDRSGLALLYTHGHAFDLSSTQSPTAMSQPALTQLSLSAAPRGLPNEAKTAQPIFALFRRLDWEQTCSPTDPVAASPRPGGGRHSQRGGGMAEGLRNRSALVVAQRLTTEAESPDEAVMKTRLWRIDRADSASLQRVKRGLLELEAMLVFYRPLAMACLLTLPVMALVFELAVMQSRVDLLLPMILPHLVVLSIVHERSRLTRRFGLFRAMREAYLAVHLSVLTAGAFLHATLKDPALFFRHGLGSPPSVPGALSAAWTATLVFSNLAALVAGLTSMLAATQPGPAGTHSWTWVFTSLALVNLVMLLCRQTALHEERHIRWFLGLKRRLPVTLVFASGRTMACTTVNFPSDDLVLNTPRPLETMPDEPLLLEFRHDRSPFNLTVHATRVEGENLFIKTDSNSRTDLVSLQQAVLSRNKKWPAWFPKKDADRLLPPRVNDLLVKLVDAATRLGSMVNLSHLRKLLGRR